MQGADDDEMAVAVGEHALERRHPRIVPVRHELFVEPREIAEVFEQLGAQALELTGTPRGDHLREHYDPFVELAERLLEHRLLLLGRQRVEEADLKLERLEADDFLTFRARPTEHVLLDAAIWLKAELAHAEVEHRDREEPRLEVLERLHVDAELAHVLRDEAINVGVEDVREDLAL